MPRVLADCQRIAPPVLVEAVRVVVVGICVTNRTQIHRADGSQRIDISTGGSHLWNTCGKRVENYARRQTDKYIRYIITTQVSNDR